MSNGGCYQVAIKCEAEEYPAAAQTCAAVVEIDFGQVEGDHLQVCTRLRLADLTFFEGWRMRYGIDILAFTDGLACLHAQMRGSARLHDWDGETVLCLTVIDRRRGRVALGGQLIPAVFWTETTSEGRLLAPRLFGTAGGIRVAFEGLVTDQSYLPPVITGLRRFLSETGISVCSPMA